MDSLYKIAEANAFESRDEKEKPSIPVEISEQEIEKIRRERRAVIIDEFQEMLRRERQKMDESLEKGNKQKEKLKLTFDKKIVNKEKELDLELVKKKREINKTSKDTIKLEKARLEQKIKEDKEKQKNDMKIEVI
jgi:hypothetical protein